MSDGTTPIAGKYADDAAFSKGFNELSTKMGLPPDARPLYGDGGRFADQSAAIAHYKAMESLHGRLTAPKPTGQPPSVGSTAGNISGGGETGTGLKLGDHAIADTDEDPATILTRAGLDPSAVEAQFVQNGKLTEEQYQALSKIGLPRGIVNTLAKGMVALRDQEKIAVATSIEKAAALVGGKQQLDVLLASAKSFVPPDQVATINRMLDDSRTTEAGVRLLLSYQGQKYGSGAPIVGNSPTRSGPAPAANSAEMNDLLRRAASGDAEAKARVAVTTPEIIQGWINKEMA